MLLESTILARTGDLNMIKFKQKGDFKKTERHLKRLGEGNYLKGFQRFGEAGVRALREATPKDTGKTAASWSYSIDKTKNGLAIRWNNSNVNDGVNIAILIQYGHGTSSGYYVEGVDYINPALAPVFDALAKDAWEEVTRSA